MKKEIIDYTYMHPGIDKDKSKKFELIDERKLIINKDKDDKEIDPTFKNLKNFLRYRIINYFKICIKPNAGSIFDCDKLDIVKNSLKEYIQVEFEKNNISIENINFSNYETDTANSVQNLLGIYMRRKYKNVYKKYKYPFGEGYRDYNFLELLERKTFDNDIVLKKFDELCSLYHTFGNMILVPKKFNKGRSGKLNGKRTYDFIDIGLNYLKENNYEWNNVKYFEIKDKSDKVFEIMTGYNYFKDIPSNLFTKSNPNKKIDYTADIKKISKCNNISYNDAKFIFVLDKMIESIKKRNIDLNKILNGTK